MARRAHACAPAARARTQPVSPQIFPSISPLTSPSPPPFLTAPAHHSLFPTSTASRWHIKMGHCAEEAGWQQDDWDVYLVTARCARSGLVVLPIRADSSSNRSRVALGDFFLASRLRLNWSRGAGGRNVESGTEAARRTDGPCLEHAVWPDRHRRQHKRQAYESFVTSVKGHKAYPRRNNLSSSFDAPLAAPPRPAPMLCYD